MIITAVQKRRTKVLLFFNNSEKLLINYEVFLSSGLYKGDFVDEAKLNSLVKEDETFNAKTSAYRYLGNRNHSSFEIKQKLQKKGYSNQIIADVISSLKQKGYLNDLEFTHSFIQNRLERKHEGLIKIKTELFKRGVSSEIITSAIENYSGDTIHYDNAKILLEKKYRSLKNKNLEYIKLKSRLYSYLRSKGFTNDVIIKSIDNLNLDVVSVRL